MPKQNKTRRRTLAAKAAGLTRRARRERIINAHFVGGAPYSREAWRRANAAFQSKQGRNPVNTGPMTSDEAVDAYRARFL